MCTTFRTTASPYDLMERLGHITAQKRPMKHLFPELLPNSLSSLNGGKRGKEIGANEFHINISRDRILTLTGHLIRGVLIRFPDKGGEKE